VLLGIRGILPAFFEIVLVGPIFDEHLDVFVGRERDSGGIVGRLDQLDVGNSRRLGVVHVVGVQEIDVRRYLLAVLVGRDYLVVVVGAFFEAGHIGRMALAEGEMADIAVELLVIQAVV